MKTKYIRVFSLVFALLLITLSGCSKNQPGENDTGKAEAYQVEVPFEDKISVFSFNDKGNIISQTNPGKATESADVTESADAAEIKYEYDKNGKKIKVSYFDAQNIKIAEKAYEYDSNGRCIKCDVFTIDSGEFAFDFGFTYEYDSNGNISKITDDKGTTEEYLYNEKNLCIKETVRSDGELFDETDFYYDDSDNLIRTDSISKDNCKYEFDSNNRLIKETYDWYVVEYEYTESNKAIVYVTYEGQERTALKTIEFFDNRKIIKESWYNPGSETEFYAISISLVEDIIENEPNPQYTVSIK